MPSSGSVVAELLAQARAGERAALDELIPIVYRELRQLARRHLRQSAGATLQTTDVVNEAYLRLAKVQRMDWRDRLHFLSVASRAMRFVLVDYARKRRYAKRGGASAVKVSLDEALSVSDERGAEVLAIDEALSELAELDPRKGDIVELRCFGGLSIDETANVLQISPATVNREWAKAKAWLHDELRQGQTQ